MRDAHEVVVNDVGEMVCRQTVRFHQYLHVDDGIFKLDLAAKCVLHDAFAGCRNFHADDMRCAFAVEFRTIIGGQQQTPAVVLWRLFCSDLSSARGRQLFRGTIAFEGMTICQQLAAMVGINRAAFRLPIGTMRASDIRTFIPAEAKPAQGFKDHLFRLGCRPCLIGIFDPQQKFATMFLGKAIIDERNIGGAYMRVTRWRWRYPGADRTGDGSHGSVLLSCVGLAAL